MNIIMLFVQYKNHIIYSYTNYRIILAPFVSKHLGFFLGRLKTLLTQLILRYLAYIYPSIVCLTIEI